MELDLADQEVGNVVEGVTVAEAKDLLQVLVAALRRLVKSTDSLAATSITKICAKLIAAFTLHGSARAVLREDGGGSGSHGAL